MAIKPEGIGLFCLRATLKNMHQNATSQNDQTGVEPYKISAFDAYITFRALGGMIVTDTGGIDAITLDEFCQQYGVNRTTVWRWKKNVPDLAERIRQRRNEVVPLARETAAFNRLYLLGMSSLPTHKDGKGRPTGALHSDQRAAVDALKTYLGHYAELQLPVQRQDIKVQGGLMEVLAAATKDGIIEGELVNAEDADAGTGGEATGILPPTP